MLRRTTMNKVILVGRTTKDIEIREIKVKGKETALVANFTLAVDDRKSDETAFINCVAWGKLAETLEQYIKKGMPVQLWGRLRTRDYEDKDGNRRFVTEAVVEGFEFCPTNIPPEKKEVKRYGRK
jgi:single-strand DNA-binding protein